MVDDTGDFRWGSKWFSASPAITVAAAIIIPNISQQVSYYDTRIRGRDLPRTDLFLKKLVLNRQHDFAGADVFSATNYISTVVHCRDLVLLYLRVPVVVARDPPTTPNSVHLTIGINVNVDDDALIKRRRLNQLVTEKVSIRPH